MRVTKTLSQHPPFRQYTITLHVEDANDEGNLNFMISTYRHSKEGNLHTPIEMIEEAMKAQK